VIAVVAGGGVGVGGGFLSTMTKRKLYQFRFTFICK